MGARARAATVAAIGLGATLAGCAAHRVEDGVFRASSGYRVTLPGPDWREVRESRADIELRHATAAAGMLANAECDPAVARRRLDVLGRQLLIGLRETHGVRREQVPLNGVRAVHAVLEGQLDGGATVRVEAYTLKDARCVYDLLLVAEPAAFERARQDFRRFVDSFATD
jgi:hypothetical protein